MPRDFPDLRSLEMAAEVWKFRARRDNEAENQYRVALADFVAPKDLVESEEIRNGVGWDKFSERDNAAMILRAALRNQ